ncbi:MAG: hypothetical protein IPF93_14455 [Saprospiraceae bacterium]|nr:hypothetical protein [Saprospiraceae bacterium]
MRVNTQLNTKLSADAKVNYIRDNFSNILSQGEGFDNPLRYLYVLPRNIRTADIEQYEFINEAGQNRQHYWIPRFNGGGNPYWTINNILQPSLRERVTGLVSLKYQILKNLSLMGRSALDRINNFTDFTRKTDSYTVAQGGSYSKTFNYGYEWNTDFLLNFNKSLTEKYHWISMVVILELPYLIRYQELV